MMPSSRSLRRCRPAFLGAAALLTFAAADLATAATESVDMGPIAGSVQGHVWSRVVDEVGNTRGRAESWNLPQGVPSRIVVTLRAPNPADLDLRIRLRFADGNLGEFKLPAPDKAIPGGFQQVISRAVPGSQPQGDVMAVTGITVHPAKEWIDQRYQLAVEITPLANQSQTATSGPSTSHDAMAARMQGVWNRRENGTLVETLEVGRDAQGWRVRGSEPNGRTNIYRILSQANGWLEVSRPFGPEYGSRIRLDGGGKLIWETYRKAGRSHVWTGSYDRASQPAAPVAAPAPPPAPSNAPLRNLALGRPASQSSTYTGTGVDQSAHHAVDGLTTGRDPHDLIHTTYQDNPWWQVDLGARSSIVKVRLFNRRNPELRTNLQLVVQISDSGDTWQTVYRHDASAWNVLDVPVNQQGRLVRVGLTNHDALQLYEVEVWGRTP